MSVMPATRAAFDVIFKNFVVTSPNCCPSRSSFLTGRYVHNTGVNGTARRFWLKFRRLEPDSLGPWLQSEGYYTGLIGKYFNYVKVQPGQKVLIIGASGGVGTFAVQIAKSFGAEVTGVCSTKADLVRSLGADHVVDYTRVDFAQREQYYDVILDTGGHSSLSHLRRALAPKVTLVIVGAETAGRWLGGFDRSIRAMLLSRFVSQKLIAFVNSENAEDLVAIKELIEASNVMPVIDRTFALSEAPKAIHYLQEGHARGKVAITV
jgi:NADPH:quinone reductase-like Zn-dependent oxidoreductase